MLTPALWFHTHDGTIRTVLDYYQTIFSSHCIIESIIPLGETPSGNAEMAQVKYFDNHTR